VWEEYLQVRQEVNLQMMELLESLGLEFAFPTRTLHIESGVETEPSSGPRMNANERE